MSNDTVQTPRGWLWASVNDVASINIGFAFKSADFSDSGIRLLRGENIEPGNLRWVDTKYWSESKLDPNRHIFVEPGDVILAMDRPVISSGLKLAKVKGEDCPCLLVQRVARLRGQLGTTGTTSYLYYALSSPAFVKHILVGGQTGTQLPHISGSRIEEFQFGLPPLSEQHRIVEALDSYLTRLDAAAEGLKRVEANLKRYRASVLKAAVEGRLVPTEAELAKKEGRDYEPASVLLERILKERRRRWEEAELAKMKAKGQVPKDEKWKTKYEESAPQDTSNLPRLPKGWCWTNLGQVFDVQVGATPARDQPSYWNGSVPWVSSGEVAFCRIRSTREYISKKGLENSSTKINPPGTVLLGMIGEGRTRGQVAILDISACNNQNVAAIRVSEAGQNSEYIYYFLWGQYQANRRLGSGNNQPALNKARVQAIHLPLPPNAEQNRIAASIEEKLTYIDSIEKTIKVQTSRITRLRQSILKWAFEGKLVDQDPNDEPASVLLERIRQERAAASDSARPTRGRKKKTA